LQLVRSVKGNLKVGHSIRNPENMSWCSGKVEILEGTICVEQVMQIRGKETTQPRAECESPKQEPGLRC
jgi:hypothetical protein